MTKTGLDFSGTVEASFSFPFSVELALPFVSLLVTSLVTSNNAPLLVFTAFDGAGSSGAADFPLAAAEDGRVKTGSLAAIVAVAGTVLERVVRRVARAVAFSAFFAVALVVRTGRRT